MIVYENTLNNFINDVVLNEISDYILKLMKDKHLSDGSTNEVNSWNNSLHFMKDVLDTSSIPKDCNVAIEYNIPQTSKRVDFMSVGKDNDNNDRVVIVELKQWAKVKKKDNIFKYTIISDLRGNELTSHPSYAR